jgi:photosystem II stability/assembly factor-like uncharacterized protein
MQRAWIGDGRSNTHALRWFSGVTPLLLLLFAFLFSSCSLSHNSWQAGTLTQQHIHALAVDGKNAQIIYAGDVDGHIFVSTDAGLHWNERSSLSLSSSTLLSLASDPSSAKLFAATSAGLFVSTDEAHSWNAIAPSRLPDDTYTAPAFTNAPLIYTGTAHHGVYVSDDDGNTWRASSRGLPGSVAISMVSIDTLQHRLWLATSLGVYRSDDEGMSWRAMNVGLPSGVVATVVEPAAAFGGDAALVYAGTTQGLYRSTDLGANWTKISVLGTLLVHAILVDFRSKNGTTVYAATNLGAFRSDDGGQNWGGVGAGLPHNAPVYTLAIGATSASQLYAASNNVYLSPGIGNTGIDWTNLLSLIIVVLVFVALFYVVRRELRRSRRGAQSPTRTGVPLPQDKPSDEE